MAVSAPRPPRPITLADVLCLSRAFGRYRVPSRSGGEPHEVNVEAGSCSCPAFATFGRTCWALKLLTVCGCGGFLYLWLRHRGDHGIRPFAECPDCGAGWWLREEYD